MLVGIIVFATTGFWMLMIFDCIRNEPQGSSWLWLTIGCYFPGAATYFAVRKLPELALQQPMFFKRWRLKAALRNAEAGIYTIGRSHQYVMLGNVLLEMGNLDRALESYQEALSREAASLPALWGCAIVEIQQQKFDRAAAHLKRLLSKEPEYKHGAASFLYGKALYKLAKWDKAKKQLDRDVNQWHHLESLLLLANIAIEQRESAIASGYLETLLAKFNAASQHYQRKNQHLVKQAQQLLKALAK